jgi:hypothetical protein
MVSIAIHCNSTTKPYYYQTFSGDPDFDSATTVFANNFAGGQKAYFVDLLKYKKLLRDELIKNTSRLQPLVRHPIEYIRYINKDIIRINNIIENIVSFENFLFVVSEAPPEGYLVEIV